MREEQRLEMAMRYAMDWYTYHAGQRMMAVRFYLLIIGALLVGYVRVYSEHPVWAFWAAVSGAVVSFVFWVLDVRNTELVNCGRAALDQLEPSLRVNIRADDQARRHFRSALWFLKAGDRGSQRALTFQLWLRILYVGMFAGSCWLAFLGWPGFWVLLNREATPPRSHPVASSQLRSLRTLMEEYVIASKQDISTATIMAQGPKVEAEILAVLRICRLDLGADVLCDRYEAWTDRTLDALRPVRSTQGDETKAALAKFAANYSGGLRAELITLELEFADHAHDSAVPSNGRPRLVGQ